MNNMTQERIKTFIDKNPIALFMKGSKEYPQCGFSNTVVKILSHFSKDFATFDVLSDPDIREGIKQYSSWPTIPQLYIQGEFIGGSDIVSDLFMQGQLALLLDKCLVKEISVEELKALQDKGHDHLVIDVRPEKERLIASLSFAKPLHSLSPEAIEALDKDKMIIFHCHHGGRSKREAQQWHNRGFKNAYNLRGGIDAWSLKIDQNVPVY